MIDEEKKEIKKEIQELALHYEKVNNKVGILENMKNEDKSRIMKLLGKLKLDSVDLDKKAEQILRVQVVHKKKIEYDEIKAQKLGVKKGVEDLIIKRVVDENGLDKAYNDGILSFEDIEKLVKEIKESSYLLVKRVKKENKDSLIVDKIKKVKK